MALAGDSVKRASVGGLYRIGITTLAVGYTDRRNDVASAPSRVAQYWVGARAQLTPQWYVAAAYYASDTKNSPNKAGMLSLLATYALSKRTDLYLLSATTRNSGAANMGVIGFGTTPAGESQQGVVAGVRHLF